MSEHEAIQCIIPPYMVDSIQQNGTEEQRAFVESTAQLSERIRAERAAAPAKQVEATPGEGLASTATTRIFDARNGTNLPGTLVRSDGDQASGDVSVNEAFDGLRATLVLYGDQFNRDSVDGNGEGLIGSVHYGRNYDNAQWNGTQMLFGDGDGRIFVRFTIAIDVMGHELTHGVTQASGGMDYNGQSGALNESMSDVFGSMVKQYHASPPQTAADADWLIGAGLLAPGINGVALRSMKAPGTAYDDPLLGKDPQPANMSGYVNTSDDNGGVHTNSGIPNHAFYLAAVALGGHAWERAGQIWYNVLTDPGRPSNLNFQDFAQRTVNTAFAMYQAEEAKKVVDAWAQVGITVSPQFVKGQLLSYGDAGTPGNVSDPDVVGFGGWQAFTFLFGGRNAAGRDRIYAVDGQGRLLSYGDAGTPGNVSAPDVVGFGGWQDFRFLFSGRNAAGQDRIYAVDGQGRLLSYGDSGTPGNVSSPDVVGFGGWQDFRFLFAGRNAAGQDRIYAVDGQGQLLSYGDSGTPGNVSDPVVVGFGGWQDFRFLFAGRNAAGQDRIYAVDGQGQLLSYGDSGTPGNVSNPDVVGFGGWQAFQFLFAGRNASGQDRIYAVPS
ncbi:M4 family metallopeptidase [Microbacterium mangrovi]|uniref:M4 family metallopeptidase n=1 Tax=Microbacterium mangrovi TaxID=1348253 RepID=UPI0009DE8A08|nr:M4 family metallopeptidase [Microbacterium mangrovi]